MNTLTLPVGDPLPNFTPADYPQHQVLAGQFVTLRPLNPAQDAASLYPATHDTPEGEAVWTYMGYGPFDSQSIMEHWMIEQADKTEPLFLAVMDTQQDCCVGMVSFLNIRPEHGSVEVGHIWYVPNVQGTRVNTESIYLLLCHAFDLLGYRRVEWKCDALNAKSQAAALRLGFQPEGLFRQHLVYKRRNRDTAWFAMLDHEWPRIKANMERWLYHNKDGILSLTEMNR